MIIPSIAQVQNIVAAALGFGYWSLVDSDTQQLIAQFDSFFDFDFNQENAVANYPIENGKFAVYNKQNNPFNVTVTLVKSGLTLPYAKKKFTEALKKYSNDALRVDVITPHGCYTDCTLSGLSFKQMPDENSDMIMARVNIKELQFFGEDAKGKIKNTNAWNRAKQGLKSMVAI